MEYGHVLLCGDWSGGNGHGLEEERRVLYVGMTRAKETLTILNRMDRRNPFVRDLTGPCFAPRRETSPSAGSDGAARDYHLLGLGDVFLDYAGRCSPRAALHDSLRALECDDTLRMERQASRVMLVTAQGRPVAQLASAAARNWSDRIDSVEKVRVVCMLTRFATDCKEPEYRDYLKVPSWEIPICEVTLCAEKGAGSLQPTRGGTGAKNDRSGVMDV